LTWTCENWEGVNWRQNPYAKCFSFEKCEKKRKPFKGGEVKKKKNEKEEKRNKSLSMEDSPCA